MLETIQEVVQSTNTTVAMQEESAEIHAQVSAAHDPALNLNKRATVSSPYNQVSVLYPTSIRHSYHGYYRPEMYHEKIMKWLDVINVNSSFDMACQKCSPRDRRVVSSELRIRRIQTCDSQMYMAPWKGYFGNHYSTYILCCLIAGAGKTIFR